LATDQLLVLETATRVQLLDTASLADSQQGRRNMLGDQLDRLVGELHTIANAVDEAHFTHLHRGRLLVGEPHVGSDMLGVVLP
jgi:hypothetical protein